MFITTLATKAEPWNQSINPWIDECMKNMWYAYTVTKRTFTTKWMEFEIFMLNETNQT